MMASLDMLTRLLRDYPSTSGVLALLSSRILRKARVDSNPLARSRIWQRQISRDRRREVWQELRCRKQVQWISEHGCLIRRFFADGLIAWRRIRFLIRAHPFVAQLFDGAVSHCHRYMHLIRHAISAVSFCCQCMSTGLCVSRTRWTHANAQIFPKPLPELELGVACVGPTC